MLGARAAKRYFYLENRSLDECSCTVGLVPFFGLYAAAASTAIAFLVMAVYRHYDAKKYVQITYEKGVFAILILLYGAVMYCYYLDTLWASVAGLCIAIVASYLLNRNELGRIRGLVMGRVKKTSDK